MSKRKQLTSALRTAKLQLAGKTLNSPDRLPPADIPRWVVYNHLKAISIDDANPTTETRRQADYLFEKVQQASVFKSTKIGDKKAYLARVLHALKRAMYHEGCVLHPRNFHHDAFSKARLQVIEALIEIGMVFEHRSPKGSPKMSRLLPMPELEEYADADPWAFDPNQVTQFVSLRERKTKLELPFDPSIHIARDTQERLELINQVNSRYEITHEHYSEWDADFTERRRLRPVHRAIFTDRWEWHGRLYTGRYGHQSLRKIERRTIEFNGCPSSELDFGGMHPRLLYHLREIDYRDDPYKLWGDDTTEAQRRLVKTLVNAAINATTRRQAIQASKFQMSRFTKERDSKGKRRYKTGKKLDDAITLHQAYRETDMTFGGIYDRAVRRHPRIADYFGSDAGMWLMRIDSSIAMDVMYHFAKRCIPCLSCHDSFIVPRQHEQDLREVMNRWYSLRFTYFPVIK
ncbi:MAG: hypothetical protein IID44_27085 [Planctomycetes bacterium]|nr:hypothetical protein [Planctomycetota bacterium]